MEIITDILQYLWQTWIIGGLFGSAIGLVYLYYDYKYDDWFREGIIRTIWGIIFGWVTVLAWGMVFLVELLAVKKKEANNANKEL